MPVIEQICVDSGWETSQAWDRVAAAALAWLQREQILVRDAVLLVPFVALAEQARAAFARSGGWQPRVETVLTLAASCLPAMTASANSCTGHTVVDRLTAWALLRRQPWAQAWAARDPGGFEGIVASVVDAAQALRQGAGDRAPEASAAFWDQARAAVRTVAGPAAVEASLLQFAVEWAASSDPPPTSTLFSLQPSAWISVRIGGRDDLAEALLAQPGMRSLLLNLDPLDGAPFAEVGTRTQVHRFLCEDFEAEACAAATVVLEALQRDNGPVALVVLDRELVRRVRALLQRRSVPVIDETGWKLATTSAATRLLNLLSAAQPHASQDTSLEWIKASPLADAVALDSLESLWRQRRRVVDPAAAQSLWANAQAQLQPLTQAKTLGLTEWLRRLRECLQADGSLLMLEEDGGGVQVLAALRIQVDPATGWPESIGQSAMNLSEFTAWVRMVLEEATFLPLHDPSAQVVITPLTRAFGRPFAHIVVPGADHRHLGGGEAPASLIGDALARELGLDHAETRRQRQRLAMAQVLRAPQVTLLRRHRDGEEILAESAAVQWLLLARSQAGLPEWPLQAWQGFHQELACTPVARPQPQAPKALPAIISATQLEALRACPYRFFARAVLRLDDPEELDAALAKRDYGTWLHAVLYHFHSQRQRGGDDAAQLAQAADATTEALGLHPGELLPYRASFDRLVPLYLAWLAPREAGGWFWADGESEHRLAPLALGGLELRGRLDRLDHGPDGAQQLLDYKTGQATGLTRQVKTPLEDTQLIFYAALLGGGEQLSAAYLPLDEAGELKEVPHPQVHESVEVMCASLGAEWQRLREGAALQALGEGAVCDTCEARGLCRRDHWEAL